MSRLIISEKSDAAARIATILSQGASKRTSIDKVPVFQFEDEKGLVSVVGLRGHILELDYPEHLNKWSEVGLSELIVAQPEKRITAHNIVGVLRDLSLDADEIIIATDGAFSMDGYIAKLNEIRVLADKYNALIMVDDCHATGFLGPKGRGSFAHHGVEVDFVTGTFGKALGGAMGGFICARKSVVELLKQRARPYLFSNALSPAVCGSSLEAIRIAQGSEGDALRTRLSANAARFRSAMAEAGFDLLPGEHPIIPVMLGDAKLAQDMAARMLELGVYVIGFSFPVVPRGQARIRTQMSAAHTFDQIDQTVAAFTKAGRELGVI